MVTEGTILWSPSQAQIEQTALFKFMNWVRANRGVPVRDYNELHAWSVDHMEDFWSSVWTYFDVMSGTPFDKVLSDRTMPGTRWFEGSLTNYAEHCLRGARYGAADRPAVIGFSEAGHRSTLSWDDLIRQVEQLATSMRRLGVVSGDRVVSYMPTVPETVVAFLATASIGAIWASAAPEFGANAVKDQFQQLTPKVLFAADGYRFAGGEFDRTDIVGQLITAIPSIEHVVWLSILGREAPTVGSQSFHTYQEFSSRPVPKDEPFIFERVDADHPLWVLFSSGTTGLPKAIAHSHVGMLVSHFCNTLLGNTQATSRRFYYTTTGWMIFNDLMSSLLVGASIVTYDGSPLHPSPDVLWKLIEDNAVTMFCASPTLINTMRQLNVSPRKTRSFPSLETLMLTGSPAPPETLAWIYQNVKDDIWAITPCGGTELCNVIVCGISTDTVRAGQIQGRALGIDARAYDERGQDVIGEVGELVIASPAPCMPLYFWNDPDGRRYRESYFSHFQNVWRHGDFIRFNDDFSSVIYGRSDSTLNRHGVRIGTAEIYRCVESMDGVLDSLVICYRRSSAVDRMVLFVNRSEAYASNADLDARIKHALRTNHSPRHVPDEIVRVGAIPYTLSGKKMEVPVRKLFEGHPVEAIASRELHEEPRRTG